MEFYLHSPPSTFVTHASLLLRASPPASASSVLNAFGFLPRHAPSRDLKGLRPRTPDRRSPSHVPCKAADQAHAASTPDTAWPTTRHPPGSSRGTHQNPRF